MINIYSVSDKYLPDFVQHGTTEEKFSEKLYDHLKTVIKVCTTPVVNRLHPLLYFSVQLSMILWIMLKQ